MKRWICLMLMILLLAGCGTDVPETTAPPTTVPVETAPPNLLDLGENWDREGVLTRLPLTVLDGGLYSNVQCWKNKLLFWGWDDHLNGRSLLSLCLVDPQSGGELARNQVELEGMPVPQVMGRSIFLCDNFSGQVMELGQGLKVTDQWMVEPKEGAWYMGSGGVLYQAWDGELTALDLETGEQTNVMGDGRQVWTRGMAAGSVCLEIEDPVTMRNVLGVLDLTTGEVLAPGYQGQFDSVSLAEGTWLCDPQGGEGVYYLGNGAQTLRTVREDASLQLLSNGMILETYYDGTVLRLFRSDGTAVSECVLSESGSCYLRMDPLIDESQENCWLMIQDYNGSEYLLHWDLTVDLDLAAMELEPVPRPEEGMRELRQRADRLQEKYGVAILLGEECDTEFYDFVAQRISDWEVLSQELDTLEEALDAFPQGFFRQIRYENIRGVQIQLVQELQATGAEWEGGSYSAFVQDAGHYQLVVVDVLDTWNESTYYHEFSHVIDRYLEWDSWNREDALYSEEEWDSHNPDWFDYAYDYQAEFWEYDYDAHRKWFIDSYSTTYPTEDRARIFENAMDPFADWRFQDNEGLREKLEYYADCIRDAFDTQGWPEQTAWEQVLDGTE